MGECASIAENRRGTVLAAWMMRDDRDGQTYKVYARRLSTSGSPMEGDFRVNTGLSSSMLAHHVSLRVDTEGWFYILWGSMIVYAALFLVGYTMAARSAAHLGTVRAIVTGALGFVVYQGFLLIFIR